MQNTNFADVRNTLVRAARRRVGSTQEAEDIVQTAFVRLLEHPPDCASAPQLEAWLKTVVRHLALDAFRLRARRRASAAVDPADIEAPVPEPCSESSEFTVEDVLRALANCDPDSRSLFELHHLRRMPYRMLALHAGVRVGTVASRLHRTRMRLRAEMVAAR